MRNCAPNSVTRRSLILSVSAFLCLGPVGCGDSAPATGTRSEVAPETKQANESMENFMKTQKKKKGR
ncbi:hypothetical protein P12x_000635 [Tundrisphaera lichenicola]|uniref:hypothetical protein n=1 Tax=Tundrisphaera lichenicola TaxID=2029860 RepID=UPI003EB71F6A